MSDVAPITPDEAAARAVTTIPDDVVAVWNDLIAAAYRNGTAVILQDVVVNALMSRLEASRSAVFKNRWLDVEPLFSKAGWRVEYDKPAYNESYETRFKFTRKS